MREVSKRQWARFCGEIANAYQFATTGVTRVEPGGAETRMFNGAPLLGLSLTRRRGKITAFEVKLGEIRNGSPAASSTLLGAPVKILHGSLGEDGVEIIEIHNEDGRKLIIRIFCKTIGVSYDSFVNEMAYFLSEARGFAPGHEQGDWFRAERIIRKAAQTCT